MKNKSLPFYLKKGIKFGPIVLRWPAWPQIIPPPTAGLNLKNRYLKIIESYLKDPDFHYSAANNPLFLGGPFINIPAYKKEFVQETSDLIKQDAAELIKLAESFNFMNELLLTYAKGQGLEFLYKKVPSMLKGMVELFYDLNNFPGYRLIEPLIYKRYYKSSHQSIIMSKIEGDFRPFALSTPHIMQEGEIEIDRPFNDPLYDRLFCSYSSKLSKDQIAEIFNSEKVDFIIKNFFQTIPLDPPTFKKYEGEGIRIRYFGHACVLIETRSICILIDPLISYKYSTFLNRFTFEDLPAHIDYVLFTHAHEDHIVLETILQIRHKVGAFIIPCDRQGNLSDPSIRLILEYTGFKNLISLEEFQSIYFKEGEILGLPFLGEHCDLNVNSKLAYCVILQGQKILFLADSNNLEPHTYKLIFKEIGVVDTIFIGMEHVGHTLTFQYGGLITIPIEDNIDKSRRLSGSDYLKALNVVEQAKCKNAYVYALGQEPWLNHIMALNYTEESLQIIHSKKFVEACKNRGINSELLFGQREWIIR